jgi:hypothetical protein
MRPSPGSAARLAAMMLLLAGACRDTPPDADTGSERAPASESVPAVLQQGDSTPAGVGIEPGLLTTVPTAPVSLWVGPDSQPFEVAVRTANPADAHTRPFGTIAMRTSLRERTPDLGQYPCKSCHLGRGIVLRDERIPDAHANVQPNHPALTGASCSTCHSPSDVEMLALKSGERATLDHVYRLCGECHSSEARAWAAGAHGKRLDGWQGRRVVMGCADCHDPHDPSIERRIPFRAPQIGRTRTPDR